MGINISSINFQILDIAIKGLLMEYKVGVLSAETIEPAHIALVNDAAMCSD